MNGAHSPGAGLVDFLQALRGLRLAWRDRGGLIRAWGDGACPLAAVARSRPQATRSAVHTWRRPEDLARLAGVEEAAGRRIMEAADANPAHDPGIRRALIEACGL